MERKLLTVILFQSLLCLAVVAYPNLLHNAYIFFYAFGGSHHERAYMCFKKDNACYVYNMTAQERIDVHDPFKIFAIEAKIANLVNTVPSPFVNGSLALYHHEFRTFNGLCNRGKLPLFYMQ